MAHVDLNFIVANEGGSRTDGYVPTDNAGRALGHSGVTIGTGVDLGQLNAGQLDALAITDALREQLRPFIGIRGSDAVEFLAGNPLSISEGDADALGRAVLGRIIGQVEAHFDAVAGDGAFAALPDAAQTVIADVAVQYGPDLAHSTPRFWSAVTAGRWGEAVAELRDFHDGYPTRRNHEADVLGTALDSGDFAGAHLPATGGLERR